MTQQEMKELNQQAICDWWRKNYDAESTTVKKTRYVNRCAVELNFCIPTVISALKENNLYP